MGMFWKQFFKHWSGEQNLTYPYKTTSITTFVICVLFLLQLSTVSIAEGAYKPLYKPLYEPQVPVINGDYRGTLYINGVPISIIMTIVSDSYGFGHMFTLRAVQDNLFIISGLCNCLDSGAILAEHGLYSECLGTDMGLMDQVVLDGWFNETGYSGELQLFQAGGQVNIPSLVGIFNLERQ